MELAIGFIIAFAIAVTGVGAGTITALRTPMPTRATAMPARFLLIAQVYERGKPGRMRACLTRLR